MRQLILLPTEMKTIRMAALLSEVRYLVAPHSTPKLLATRQAAWSAPVWPPVTIFVSIETARHDWRISRRVSCGRVLCAWVAVGGLGWRVVVPVEERGL